MRSLCSSFVCVRQACSARYALTVRAGVCGPARVPWAMAVARLRSFVPTRSKRFTPPAFQTQRATCAAEAEREVGGGDGEGEAGLGVQGWVRVHDLLGVHSLAPVAWIPAGSARIHAAGASLLAWWPGLASSHVRGVLRGCGPMHQRNACHRSCGRADSRVSSVAPCQLPAAGPASLFTARVVGPPLAGESCTAFAVLIAPEGLARRSRLLAAGAQFRGGTLVRQLPVLRRAACARPPE